MRIAIVGSGGVGGYFGARLALAGADVSFVARGEHLRAMRGGGLRIESPKGDAYLPQVTATDDPAALGPMDVVFFTVKLYDTDSAAGLLAPLIGANTVVIPFQNGVESVEALVGGVGRSHLAGGTAYVWATISEPGIVRHMTMDHLIFGELDGSRTSRLERLLELCKSAGFEATLSEHIEVDIWSKFVHLTAFSGMTTVTRCAVGALRDDPDLWAMSQAAVMESMAVARAKGIALPPDIFHEIVATVQTLPPNAKSSMLQDLERGRRLELPWLSGAVVRLGGELGVETPIHRFITTVLAPHVQGIQKRIERSLRAV